MLVLLHNIHFKMITRMSLVTICHCTKILHNYWLYSPHCTFHRYDIYFATGNLYPLISLTYFSPPHSFLSGNHLIALSVYDFLIMVVHLFYFSDSTYKWNHTVSFFLCWADFIQCNILKVLPFLLLQMAGFPSFSQLMLYCTYTTSSLSVHPSAALELFPHLAYCG